MIRILCVVIVLSSFGCKIGSSADIKSEVIEGKNAYRLSLNPKPGSGYHYDIVNESDIEIEVNDKTIKSNNKSTIGVNYYITNDSVGNYLLDAQYDKIHVYANNNGTETEMDADNAATTSDPIEKMLGVLKAAKLSVVINNTGVVKTIYGYQELGDTILSMFGGEINERTMIKSQWDKLIGQGIVKNGLEQLFNIFPDSLVKVGDRWKISSRQEGEITMNIKTTYNFDNMDNGVAIVKSTGEIMSDNRTGAVMINDAKATLKGSQKGQYKADVRTGMLLENNTTSSINGKIEVMGNDVPVEIKTKLKVVGKQVR